jgi:hypothetical protein
VVETDKIAFTQGLINTFHLIPLVCAVYGASLPWIGETVISNCLDTIIRLLKEELNSSNVSPSPVSAQETTSPSTPSLFNMNRPTALLSTSALKIGTNKVALKSTDSVLNRSPSQGSPGKSLEEIQHRRNSSLEINPAPMRSRPSESSTRLSLAELNMGPCLEFILNHGLLSSLVEMAMHDVRILQQAVLFISLRVVEAMVSILCVHCMGFHC